MPEIADEEHVEPTERSGLPVCGDFRCAEFAHSIAELHVYVREKLCTDHADLVNDKPPPLKRPFGDVDVRLRSSVAILLLAEDGDAACVV